MTYLVSLALGPVQEFIKAALRTRDLWMGSELLSEVSKAAAAELARRGAQLVLPAPEDDTALAPDSGFNVANRVLAVVEGDPREALDGAKAAAEERLDALAGQARGKFGRLARGEALREDRWEAQRCDLLELYGVWVPLEGGYAAARRRVDRLAAARKNTRQFAQTTLDPFDRAAGFGLPKSSLDARRETVLPDGLDEAVRRRLRLGEGEQLDLPGLVKRLAGPEERFTPVTRLSADPWLRRLDADARAALGKATEPLVALGLATRVLGNERVYRAYPYDGDLLYRDRLEKMLEALRKEEPEAVDLLKALRDRLRPLWKKHGEPGSYYGLLLADGDRMGELLDRVETVGQHREVSRALARFAAGVPEVVRAHRGHCIYAGGDDVLALLPLDETLACAEALRKAFAQAMAPEARSLNAPAPTLSVGLALAHRLEPLGRVRGWAEEAERIAKGSDAEAPRNALGLVIAPRSGAPLRLRRRWEGDPVSWLERLRGEFRAGRLPHGLPYELRDVAQRVRGEDPAAMEKLMDPVLRGVLGRKREGGGAQPVDPALVVELLRAVRERGVGELIDELLAARWLAERMPKEEGS